MEQTAKVSKQFKKYSQHDKLIKHCNGERQTQKETKVRLRKIVSRELKLQFLSSFNQTSGLKAICDEKFCYFQQGINSGDQP